METTMPFNFKSEKSDEASDQLKRKINKAINLLHRDSNYEITFGITKEYISHRKWNFVKTRITRITELTFKITEEIQLPLNQNNETAS